MTDFKNLHLERFVPYRLSILSNVVSSTIAKTYRNKFELSVTEWRIMAVLGEFPGLSGEEVSLKTQIEKSMLSRAIQKLLKRNLIERSIDSSDRRKQILTLSSEGKKIYQQVVPMSLQYETELLQCFNSEEQQQFSQLVDRLYKHANKMNENR